MRSTLLTLPNPGLPVTMAILAVEIVIIAVWLSVLRRRDKYSPDYLYTGIALFGITAVLLGVMMKMGHLEIKSYGAMLMCGFLAGVVTATRLGRRRGVPGERVIDLGLVILVGAILGARIAYILQNPGEPLFNLHDVLNEGLGGLSFHGGLIGGLLTGGAYIRATRMNFWRVTDSCAPAIALGYAITRIGCFLNGCCLGVPANLPWAMVFPDSPVRELRGIPVHPTQLYASAMGFAMFGILLLLSRGRSLGRAGRLFMVLLMLEGIERFVMEIYRYPASTGLSAAQVVSIIIFIIGGIGFFVLPKHAAVDDVKAVQQPVKK